jgi:hypothetical protein
MRRQLGNVTHALIVGLLVLLSCASNPKHQTDTIDDDCKDNLTNTVYRMRMHREECVSLATFGEGRRFVDGASDKSDGAWPMRDLSAGYAPESRSARGCQKVLEAQS